jgi:hypothetical protein
LRKRDRTRFLREVITLSTPYIDLDRILANVAEPATLAGWTEEELTDAVIRLAARHGMERSQPFDYGRHV